MYTIEQGLKLVAQMISDPVILKQYDLAREMSKDLTDHGRQHAFAVLELGKALATKLEELTPGFFTDWERDVYLPIALFGHDIGRSQDGPKHAELGAQIIGHYLEKHGMPAEHRREPCWAIRNHRADRCLSLDFNSKVWALLVLADKCVGDEARVTGWKSWKLRFQSLCGITQKLWLQNPNADLQNSLANFAIKKAWIDVDPGDVPSPRYRGAIVLKVDLDLGVATLEQILSVEWFSEAFHSCARAAQYLGFVFRIESNRTRYFWSKEEKGWRQLVHIDVPRA